MSAPRRSVPALARKFIASVNALTGRRPTITIPAMAAGRIARAAADAAEESIVDLTWAKPDASPRECARAARDGAVAAVRREFQIWGRR